MSWKNSKNEDYVLCTQKIEIRKRKILDEKRRISLLIKGLIVFIK